LFVTLLWILQSYGSSISINPIVIYSGYTDIEITEQDVYFFDLS